MCVGQNALSEVGENLMHTLENSASSVTLTWDLSIWKMALCTHDASVSHRLATL